MAEGAGSANIAGEVSIISGKPREIRPLLDTSVTTGLIESSGSNARGALSSLKLGKGSGADCITEENACVYLIKKDLTKRGLLNPFCSNVNGTIHHPSSISASGFIDLSYMIDRFVKPLSGLVLVPYTISKGGDNSTVACVYCPILEKL